MLIIKDLAERLVSGAVTTKSIVSDLRYTVNILGLIIYCSWL